MRSQLVVSLSGIGVPNLSRCADFAEELDRRRVPISLLLTPRPATPERAPALDWVRDRIAGADELALHGFDHTADPRARHLNLLRRAEFAALPAHESGLRLIAARAALDRLGLDTETFAPPRWLASPGMLTALRRHRFTRCADAATVRDLVTGRTHVGRVHGLGRTLGERAEPWWCLALVLGAGRAARRGGLVRITVDAADLDRPGPRQAVLDAVDIALHHGAVPTTYPALGGQTSVPSPSTRARTSEPVGARRVSQG